MENFPEKLPELNVLQIPNIQFFQFLILDGNYAREGISKTVTFLSEIGEVVSGGWYLAPKIVTKNAVRCVLR
jgi:hypothetical protein